MAHLLLAAFDAELLTALRDQGRAQRNIQDAIRLVAAALVADRGAAGVD
jgi:hypothetical protein